MSFIRQLLECADVEWDNWAQYEINEFKNEAARILTSALKLVSTENLLRETCWEKPSSRRKKHILLLFYKMEKYVYPEYLSSLL